jgi:putative transposase
VNRVFRYRIYPTAKQTVALEQMLRDHCDMYNAALQERRDAYRCGVKVRYGDQSAQLKAIRADEQYARWSFSSQQQTLKRLDRAFVAFFTRVKRGETPGYPRFRSSRRFDTVTFIDGDGGAYLPDTARVRMQGVGHVKVKQHRPVRGTTKQFSVTRQGRKWFVNVICTDVPQQLRPLTGAVIGLDRGVTHLLADSDGGFTENPRHLRSAEARLAAAQIDLSRKKRGSTRRRKAAFRVAALHRHVANTRRDNLHKVSRRLVDTYDLIALEALRVRNMTRSAKGTVDAPGSNVAAKSGLNKSILDAGWSALAQMIQYKAESAGTDVVFVPAANTSRMCHECGHIAAGNRDGEAFTCLTCGHTAHADTNAARNILRLGLSLRPVAPAA